MTELSIDKIKKEILKLGGKLLEFTLKEKDGDCSNFEKITTEDYERNLYIKKYITRNENLKTIATNIFSLQNKQLYSTSVEYLTRKYKNIYEGVGKKISMSKSDDDYTFLDTTEDTCIVFESGLFVVTKTTKRNSNSIMDTIINVYYKDNGNWVYNLYINPSKIEFKSNGINNLDLIHVLFDLKNNTMDVMLRSRICDFTTIYSANDLEWNDYECFDSIDVNINRLKNIDTIDESYLNYLFQIKLIFSDSLEEDSYLYDNEEVSLYKHERSDYIIKREDNIVTIITQLEKKTHIYKYSFKKEKVSWYKREQIVMKLLEKNIPYVKVGEVVELNDLWDGNGECPLEMGSYSYQVGYMEWKIYIFELVEKKENQLDTLVKITEIELL